MIRAVLAPLLLAGLTWAGSPTATHSTEQTGQTAPESETAVPPPPPAAEESPGPDTEPATDTAGGIEVQPATATGGEDAPNAEMVDESLEPDSTDSDELRTIETAATEGRALTQLSELSLLFGENLASLSDETKLELKVLAGYLEDHPDQRVQLLAYARATDNVGSRARRLSLSRALAVRGFLADKGIEPTRIDIRPLGSEVDDGPPDRVDVLPAER